MTRAMRFELFRLATRRDLVLVTILFALLLLVREVLNVTSLATIPHGVDIPQQALDEQARLVSGYSKGASIGTVLFNSWQLLFVFVGVLVCWTIGAEFSTGTVRTALVSFPNRPSYLAGRLLGSLAVAVIALVVVLGVGVAVPLVAESLGLPIPQGGPSPSFEEIGFGLAALTVPLVAVSVAAVLAVTIRSPLPAALAFVASTFAIGFAGQARLTGDWTPLLPLEALLTLLKAAAPEGSVLPPVTGQMVFQQQQLPVPILAADVLAWSAAFFLLAFASFTIRDVRE